MLWLSKVGGGAGGVKEEAKGDPQHGWSKMSFHGQTEFLPPNNDICQPLALWIQVNTVYFRYGSPRCHPRRITLFWSLYRTGWTVLTFDLRANLTSMSIN